MREFTQPDVEAPCEAYERIDCAHRGTRQMAKSGGGGRRRQPTLNSIVNSVGLVALAAAWARTGRRWRYSTLTVGP
jgi:hypothetical protein